MKGIRARSDQKPAEGKKVIGQATFKKTFELGGESLKTAPKGYPKDHPMIEDLRRKDFIAVAPLGLDEVTSTKFEATVGRHLKIAAPYMEFLCKAIGQPF